MLVTDSASYSDVVFGLFMLLDRFCPRLADLGDTRFYRINRTLTTAR
jgi:TnpA family transposase